MTTELLLLMLLGMGNGLLHAFDADHIVAVSSLAGRGEISRYRIFRTAALWSLGHGTVLLCIVVLVLGLGVAMPEPVFRAAELAIGVILVAVGAGILSPLMARKVRISRHRHGDQPPHIHLHRENHRQSSDHRPVLVGMIHGVAGSAPLLAVLPAMFQQNYGVAALYILLFSVCVGLAMCVFGGVLGQVSQVIGRRLESGILYFQRFLGLQAIAFGGYWIYASL